MHGIVVLCVVFRCEVYQIFSQYTGKFTNRITVFLEGDVLSLMIKEGSGHLVITQNNY